MFYIIDSSTGELLKENLCRLETYNTISDLAKIYPTENLLIGNINSRECELTVSEWLEIM